jgi:predicted HTH domain antitoxin
MVRPAALFLLKVMNRTLDTLFTIQDIVIMKTSTLSTRVSEQENEDLDFLSRVSGLDRANLMKLFLRNGMKQMKMDLAVSAYAEERASLSRAAEMAGISLQEFLARMPENRLEMTYDTQEFEEDVRTLGLF